jgi:hypothetical protein
MLQDDRKEIIELIKQLKSEKKILSEKIIDLENKLIELEKTNTLLKQKFDTLSLNDLSLQLIEFLDNKSLSKIKLKESLDTYIADLQYCIDLLKK